MVTVRFAVRVRFTVRVLGLGLYNRPLIIFSGGLIPAGEGLTVGQDPYMFVRHGNRNELMCTFEV